MSRPSGKVTNLLVIGLSLVTFSAILDLFDEFMAPISAINWISLFESIPAAIGMFVMTYALYLWHLEQLALNQQLERTRKQPCEQQGTSLYYCYRRGQFFIC
jgi:hypothetical protein